MLSLLLLVGCKREEIDQNRPEENLPENFVSQNAVAKLLDQVGQVNKTKSGADAPFTEVESITAYKGEDSQPAFYALNYKNGGFVIMSADDRVSPILAYSENGKFTSTDGNIGLTMWIDETKDGVTALRSSGAEQSEDVAASWQPENIAAFLRLPPGLDEMQPLPIIPECFCKTTTVGPLLTSKNIIWHQDYPFNGNAPIVYDGGNSRIASAGCVPVAVGMIMAYHGYPTKYDYNNTAEKARLLRDLGINLGANYQWENTSVDQARIPSSFTSTQFGYATANDGGFDLGTVMSNLDAGLPVILNAGSKGGGLWNPRYENGHAWVCEGYRREYTCTGHKDMEIESDVRIYLYMNWGLSGKFSANNAYYRSDRWNPKFASDNGYEFDYRKSMVYNIKPR